ncbi:MAG: hypothetical protein A3H42_01605 [Deltaproteobacteria bacterium RIFCSPLOWO2_02_FULL_46_8]|nr:MAG: hypothetical protein A3H42_01605 [Deltaproteobacteria bacterium RIFCSPLOWO2_02_FULL_46_8]
MHPDLLNNSHFLRYYNLWQEDPSSIVFAPIAEYLLSYGLIDEALKVCLAGLQYHPQLVSGHLILAKIYLRQKKWDEVRKETQIVLNLVPNHEKAVELQNSLEQPPPPPVSKKVGSWETVTMAKIYAAQGHVAQATEVYQTILSREPHNEEAKRGLSELQSDNR